MDTPGALQPSPTPKPAPKLRTSDGWWPAIPQWDGPRINVGWHPSLETAVRAIVRLGQAQAGAVVLTGNPGCGKTLLTKILVHSVGGVNRRFDHAAGESYWSAVTYAEPTLLDAIRASYAYEDGFEQLVEKCANARLLILDDIGAGYVKSGSEEWYDSLLWRFLDNRRDKKTILTTNLRPKLLAERLGYRCFSRLKDMLSVDMERGSDNLISMFDVPDFRGKSW
jgi:DNA replication protein DnaC